MPSGLSSSNPAPVNYNVPVKIVGKRRTSGDFSPISPGEALARAAILQEQLERLNPFPKPRGFVFKARTVGGIRALAQISK